MGFGINIFCWGEVWVGILVRVFMLEFGRRDGRIVGGGVSYFVYINFDEKKIYCVVCLFFVEIVNYIKSRDSDLRGLCF